VDAQVKEIQEKQEKKKNEAIKLQQAANPNAATTPTSA
jgi:hypothetical protein